MNSKECVDIIVNAIDDKKGMDIQVFDVGDNTTIADYFVIATGGSTTHIHALADSVRENMHKTDYHIRHVEGDKSSGWVLLDYGDLVVHLMSKDQREFYDLERLWNKKDF